MLRTFDQDLVFCFGSNERGRHGAGGALDAKQRYGAIEGQGEGLQGQSYAIPTKDRAIQTLPLERIAQHVDRFIDFARAHPDLKFQMTRIGCGLAGYQDAQIAPLFKDAPENVLLPGIWEYVRGRHVQRIIVAGSRDFEDREFAFPRIAHMLSKVPNGFEIISGGARGADTIGEEWAKSQHAACVRFPAKWDAYGKRAGFIRNALMGWYATHLIAFWDGVSPGTKGMIEFAKGNGLQVKVFTYTPAPFPRPAPPPRRGL